MTISEELAALEKRLKVLNNDPIMRLAEAMLRKFQYGLQLIYNIKSN
jgi:hypothetical protein